MHSKQAPSQTQPQTLRRELHLVDAVAVGYPQSDGTYEYGYQVLSPLHLSRISLLPSL